MSIFGGRNTVDLGAELDLDAVFEEENPQELAWRAVEEAILEYVNVDVDGLVVDVPHFVIITDERAYDEAGNPVDTEVFRHTPIDQPDWITEKLCGDVADSIRRGVVADED